MNVKELIKKLENCPCGREHKIDIKCVEIGKGVLPRVADILKENGFPSDILVVSDKNELAAAGNILEILKNGGISYTLLQFDNLREADIDGVNTVAEKLSGHGGCLSVGTGSCNDICRRASYLKNKPFAIFATAPSMDGFASDTAPITENNFKISMQARQPEILMGDTDILSAAPAELKAAGFGDMIAKYVAVADWRISTLVSGEYFCDAVADITREAAKRITALADRITEDSPEAAGAVMETLVLTGIAMKLTGTSRPASGAEHVVSHFWEIKKLEAGLLSDYHGKKVGVATLCISRLYHDIINTRGLTFHEDRTNWDDVYAVYGENFKNDITKMNTPTITADISPETLKNNWEEICRAVREELPDPETVEKLLRTAGAPTSYKEIDVKKDLALAGLKYHAYMRKRINLTRLLPMIDYTPDYEKILGD